MVMGIKKGWVYIGALPQVKGYGLAGPAADVFPRNGEIPGADFPAGSDNDALF
jgi:hypothetical protein